MVIQFAWRLNDPSHPLWTYPRIIPIRDQPPPPCTQLQPPAEVPKVSNFISGSAPGNITIISDLIMNAKQNELSINAYN